MTQELTSLPAARSLTAGWGSNPSLSAQIHATAPVVWQPARPRAGRAIQWRAQLACSVLRSDVLCGGELRFGGLHADAVVGARATVLADAALRAGRKIEGDEGGGELRSGHSQLRSVSLARW